MRIPVANGKTENPALNKLDVKDEFVSNDEPTV